MIDILGMTIEVFFLTSLMMFVVEFFRFSWMRANEMVFIRTTLDRIARDGSREAAIEWSEWSQLPECQYLVEWEKQIDKLFDEAIASANN